MQTTSPYKTAVDLGIEQWEHDGLVALIGPLSRGELPIDMRCGTAACIGGYVNSNANMPHGQNIESGYASPGFYSGTLYKLYYPTSCDVTHPAWRCNSLQAARAIVNFLTLGDPRWDDVMREPA